MKTSVFLISLLAGCAYVSALKAEPLTINPYPEAAPVQVEDVAPPETEVFNEQIESLPVAPVFEPVEEVVVRSQVGFSGVPQPGDSYFDAMSVPAAVQDQGFEARETDAYISPTSQPEFPVAQAPELKSAPEPQEELRMSMSADPFDDLLSSDSAPLPPQRVQGSLAKPPVKALVEEKIVWNAPRAPLQTKMPEKVSQPSASASRGWRALEGGNIRQVLEAWSRQERVKLIWDSQDNFAVLEEMKSQGSYESAVQTLLNQYQNNQVRPLGTLHVDPKTQQKTLVVRILQGA